MKVAFVGVGVTSSQLQGIGPAANNLLADVAGEEDALVNLVNPAKTTSQERLMISDFNRASSSAAPNGNLDMPGWVSADVLDIEINRLVAQHLPISSANVLVALRQNYTITTGVMPPANFSSPGLIPGYNRIHNTDVNYIKIVNYQQQPAGYGLHNTAAALTSRADEPQHVWRTARSAIRSISEEPALRRVGSSRERAEGDARIRLENGLDWS
jgi:hypothetical protein